MGGRVDVWWLYGMVRGQQTLGHGSWGPHFPASGFTLTPGRWYNFLPLG